MKREIETKRGKGLGRKPKEVDEETVRTHILVSGRGINRGKQEQVVERRGSSTGCFDV